MLRVPLLLLWQAVACAAPSTPGLTIDVSVLDLEKQGVSGVQVQLRIGQNVVSSAETDLKGHVEFVDLRPAHYAIAASKSGFESAYRGDLDLQAGTVSVELTLVPALARRESIEVKGTATALEQ